MNEPEQIPLNALFGTDFVSLLVVVLSSDTMAQVCEKVAANVVGKRVAPRELAMAVYFQDRRMPDDWSVARAQIGPMQFVFVDYVEG
ncbi:MAG TPA: toluene-4-monooxygenase system B family protein [Polyangiaceae bacterium]|jgi:toluene monooxygenase system protein B|nr:toluene-4-monooxygenase system B family protein [Polyangiaceae bacterium]